LSGRSLPISNVLRHKAGDDLVGALSGIALTMPRVFVSARA
jgi:hypothetical protein